MFALLISLLSLCADHYGTGIIVHVLFCYALLVCAVVALPRIRTPHLALYIGSFWSGLGIFYACGGALPQAILNDVVYLL